MTDPVTAKVGWRTSIPFGIGAFASAAKTVPVTTFLMLFYNQVMKLPAITVSTVLMVSLILDAVFDPLVGQISDNFRSRWGRRLPFMYASAIPTTVLFIMLWTPPAGWSHGALIAYLTVCVIGLRFCDTFFDLPHVALVPELSSQYNERTKLFTIRYVFEAIGGAGVGLLAYLYFMKERPDGTGGLLSPEGYPAFAWFTGALILITIMTCCIGLHQRLVHPVPPPARKIPFGTMMREIAVTVKTRSFAALIATGFFLALGSGIGSSLSLYWTLYVYQFSQAQLSLLVAPVMLGTLATGIAPLIAKRFGKRDAAILLSWIYVVAASVPLVARVTDLLPAKSPALFGMVMLQTAVAPATMTMVLIMLGSMISDLVEDAEVRTGRRSEGLLLAANSFVRKATQGLGTLGAGIVLSLASFPEGAERKDVPESILTHMVILYIVVTIVLFIGTTVSLRLYRVDKGAHEANLRILSKRAAAANAAPEVSDAGAVDPDREEKLANAKPINCAP